MRPATAWAVVSLRFREVLQYRAAAWAGVFTQVIFGFIILMSLRAFAASGTADSPLSPEQLTAYVWLGQCLFTLMPWNADRSVVAMVRTGSVAYELVRPVDTYALWYCRTLGWRTSMVCTRALPLLVLVGVVFPLAGLDGWALPAPASAGALACFLVALAVGVLLATALGMLMHVTILWTLDPEGVTRLAPAFVMLLSGMIIPLPLFPDAVQPLLAALPFRGLIDVPLRLYGGHIPVAAALGPIALSAAWTAALIVLGRWMMARGLRQIVIQGG
ncbi:MAG: ABC transporter permease [Puniceicoccaceae bacterium]|nr:MAG: ABC transporter permease [Puniceicoccaceae bacterium]